MLQLEPAQQLYESSPQSQQFIIRFLECARVMLEHQESVHDFLRIHAHLVHLLQPVEQQSNVLFVNRFVL